MKTASVVVTRYAAKNAASIQRRPKARTRYYPGETYGIMLARILNRADRDERDRIIALMDDFKRFDKMTRENRKANFRYEEMFALGEQIGRTLASLGPTIEIPPQGLGWSVRWGSGPPFKISSFMPFSDTEKNAVGLVLKLAELRRLDRIGQCDYCHRFLYTRFRGKQRNFCQYRVESFIDVNDELRVEVGQCKKNFRETRQAKDDRAEYMRTYRRAAQLVGVWPNKPRKTQRERLRQGRRARSAAA